MKESLAAEKLLTKNLQNQHTKSTALLKEKDITIEKLIKSRIPKAICKKKIKNVALELAQEKRKREEFKEKNCGNTQ